MGNKEFWSSHSIKSKKPVHTDVKRGGRPPKMTPPDKMMPTSKMMPMSDGQMAMPMEPPGAGPSEAIPHPNNPSLRGGTDFTVPPYITSNK